MLTLHLQGKLQTEVIETLYHFVKAGPRGLTKLELGSGLERDDKQVVRRITQLKKEPGVILREGYFRDETRQKVWILDCMPSWAGGILRNEDLPELWAAVNARENDALNQFAGRIAHAMGQREQEEGRDAGASLLQKRIRTLWPVRPRRISRHQQELIQQAILEGRSLGGRFSEGRGPGPRRMMLPHSLVTDLFCGQGFLVGLDFTGGLEGGLEVWPLDRVQDIETGPGAPISELGHATVELALDYALAGEFSDEEPFEVKFQVHGRRQVDALLHGRFPLRELSVQPGPDPAEASATFRTNTLQGARTWLLSMGSDITVLEPRELVEEVEGELREALNSYEERVDKG